MALFTDTVTVYQKQASGDYLRTVLKGVQWRAQTEKSLSVDRLSTTRSYTLTVPPALIGSIDFSSFTEEDAVFFGEVTETISDDVRLSTLLKTYTPSAIIRSVADNTHRDHLKNWKVVCY